MAFTYVVTSPTGDRAGCTEIGDNLYLAYGTYDADTDAIGDIVTGLGTVIAYGVNNGEVHTECPKTAPNVLSSDFTTAALGTIAVDAATADNFGSWWAIGQK